jgi:hypothetical protein
MLATASLVQGSMDISKFTLYVQAGLLVGRTERELKS